MILLKFNEFDEKIRGLTKKSKDYIVFILSLKFWVFSFQVSSINLNHFERIGVTEVRREILVENWIFFVEITILRLIISDFSEIIRLLKSS